MKTYWVGVDSRGLRSHALARNPDSKRSGAPELPSPYDVPEALKIKIDDDAHSAEIEFVYPGEREFLEAAVDDREVRILVGRYSRRIHCLRLDGERIPGSRPIGDPLQALIDAIDQLIQKTVCSSEDARAYANYMLARTAVQENASKAISRRFVPSA